MNDTFLLVETPLATLSVTGNFCFDKYEAINDCRNDHHCHLPSANQ